VRDAIRAHPRVVDAVLGIGLPVLCLALDPIVFRSRFPRAGLLEPYALGAYAFIGLALACLAWWLAFRRPSVILGGALAAACVSSLLLGVVLLPVSIAGLFALVGLLGCSPFLVAHVYWRNAAAVLGAAARPSGAFRRSVAAIAGAVLVVGLPIGAQTLAWEARSLAIEDAHSTDLATSNQAIRRLRLLSRVVDLDPLVRAYANEEDPARRARLATAYRESTGGEIEERLSALVD
jgi:hypothetical protein